MLSQVTSLVERASNTSDEMRRLKEEFHQKVNSIEMMVEIMKQMMQYNELLVSTSSCDVMRAKASSSK